MNNKSLQLVVGRAICVVGLCVLALGACSKAEQEMETAVSFPIVFGDSANSLDASGKPFNPLLLIRLWVRPLSDTGEPMPEVLTSIQALGRTFFDPANGKGSCNDGVCHFNMPLPVPAGKNLRISTELYLARRPGDGISPAIPPGVSFWTQIFAGELNFLGSLTGLREEGGAAAASAATAGGMEPVTCLPIGLVPRCDLPLGAVPRGTVAGTVSLDLLVAEDTCVGNDKAGPAEEAIIVAYDTQTGLPLASVNAAETSLSQPRNQAAADGGQFNFLSTLPLGRSVDFRAVYNGEALFNNDIFWLVNEDLLNIQGEDVGAFGFFPAQTVAVATPLDLVIDECPPTGQVNVRFFDEASLAAPLTMGSPNTPTAGTLLGAAELAFVPFTIHNEAQPYYVDSGGFTAVIDGGFFLHTDASHVYTPTSGGVAASLGGAATKGLSVPADPFGLMTLPTYELPFASKEQVTSLAGDTLYHRTNLHVADLADPNDPCTDLALPCPFSAPAGNDPRGVKSRICSPDVTDRCVPAPAIVIEQVEIVPGEITQASVLVRRTNTPTVCGVDLRNGSIRFLHPNDLDPLFSGGMQVAYRGLTSGDVGYQLCDFIDPDFSLPPPFDTEPHWACGGGIVGQGLIIGGGGSLLDEDFELSVATDWNSFLGPNWASPLTSFSCVRGSKTLGGTRLVTIDPVAGAVTLVGLTPDYLDAIAFGPATCSGLAGRLFAAESYYLTSQLYELDPVDGSIISIIGPLSQPVTGLAISPTTCKAYATPSSYLGGFYEVNLGTGALTPLGSVGSAGYDVVTDLAFGPAGVLYGLNNNNSDYSLLQIDPTACNGGSDTICDTTELGLVPVNQWGGGAIAVGANGGVFTSVGDANGDGTYDLQLIAPLNGGILANRKLLGGANQAIKAMSVDPVTGALYGVDKVFCCSGGGG